MVKLKGLNKTLKISVLAGVLLGVTTPIFSEPVYDNKEFEKLLERWPTLPFQYHNFARTCNRKIDKNSIDKSLDKKQFFKAYIEKVTSCINDLENQQKIAKYNGRVKSAEYYATHNKEREFMAKKCEEIYVQSLSGNKEPAQEQQVHCEQVELGENLHKKRLEKQLQKQALEQRKNIIKDLAHCYIEMANSLEKGKDYLKEDKKCKKYIYGSAGGGALQFYGTGLPIIPYPSNLAKYVSSMIDSRQFKVNSTQLQRCYKTFANNLLKHESYEPLEENFLIECRKQMEAYFHQNKSFT
ncbi:hypothetical protein KVF10_04820 [Helicobacter pylori]|nr:hypothetical protein KVF10_04820 [Helicobacter pylori]